MKWLAGSVQIAVLLLVVLVGGCKENPSSYEVAHVVSPNGKLVAILTETNGGATTSFGYDVSIGVKGSKSLRRVGSFYGAIRNEQAYGVNLSWPSDSVRRVSYLRAKAVQNVSKAIDVAGQPVEVELQSGVEDATAPSGGMHYNLTKQSH